MADFSLFFLEVVLEKGGLDEKKKSKGNFLQFLRFWKSNVGTFHKKVALIFEKSLSIFNEKVLYRLKFNHSLSLYFVDLIDSHLFMIRYIFKH